MTEEMTSSQVCMWFNTTTLHLVTEIARLFPKSTIANNIQEIKNMMRTKESKLIELFVINVLPEKEYIDSGNEDYFLGKTDKKNKSNKQLFEMKEIWMKLSKDNKKMMISYMKFMCEYAQRYFMIHYGTV